MTRTPNSVQTLLRPEKLAKEQEVGVLVKEGKERGRAQRSAKYGSVKEDAERASEFNVETSVHSQSSGIAFVCGSCPVAEQTRMKALAGREADRIAKGISKAALVHCCQNAPGISSLVGHFVSYWRYLLFHLHLDKTLRNGFSFMPSSPIRGFRHRHRFRLASAKPDIHVGLLGSGAAAFQWSRGCSPKSIV